MNRFGAFAVHLGISLVIFAVLGYLIVFHWYPDFFFASDGGWQGVRIVALVDLVLGPLLTLIVYKAGKPSLKFDLTTIAVIQAVALTAGVWVVYTERPIAMVFSDGSFTSMSADDYREVDQALPDLAPFAGNPAWVSVVLPEDPREQAVIRGEAYRASIPLRTKVDLYQPFSLDHIDPLVDGVSRDILIDRDRQTPFLDEFLAENGGTVHDYLFLPFGTRFSFSLLAMRLEDNELIFLEVPAVEEPVQTAAAGG
jgi:hypothetical protein